MFATIQRRLGPPKRVFVVASPFKVLHLSLSSDGWGQWDLFGSVFGFEGGNAVRFCHFVFSCLARCPLSFFSILSFLRFAA